MIQNKNQLKNRLKQDKDSLVFITLKNPHFPESIGKPRKANKIQNNAFTLLTKNQDGEFKDSWIWYNQIRVKDNVIIYLDNKGMPEVEISIVELINVSKKYYNEYPDEHKSIIDGIPHILRLKQNKGPILTPVRLID